MSQPSRPSVIGSGTGFIAFLGWTILCVALYFWKIPPRPIQCLQELFFSFQQPSWTWTQILQTWAGHGLWLLSLAVTLVIFLGVGSRMLAWVNPPPLSALERWTWSLALGMLFWGILAEGLAFEKLFYIVLLQGLVAAAAVFFLIRDRWEAVTRCWPLGEKVELPSLWKWPLGLAALLCLANLSAPEMSWDAMTYQLILPKYYFCNHGFYPVTGIAPAHYPSLGQMFFSWGLLWGNDSLARSLCFLVHLGTALALAGIGGRILGGKAGWTAAAFYWLFPYLNIFATRGYVDLFTGFYAVMGLGSLIRLAVDSKRGTLSGNERSLWFLGFLALGAVGGIKYNAPFFWLAGATLTAFGALRQKTSFSIWCWLFLFPIFFFGPWAVKSWEYTHNPLFPYLPNFFHTLGWTDFDQKSSLLKFPLEGLGGLLKLPLLPWRVTFENYSGAPNEETGLVFLAILPLLFLRGPERAWRFPVTLCLLIPLLAWLVTSHQLRLIQPVIAFGALALAAGYENALSRWRSYGKTLEVVLAFLLCLNAYYLFRGLVQQPNPFPNFVGVESREQFLEKILRPQGYLRVAEALNEKLPVDAKVLVLGQQNGYYLDRVSSYEFDYSTPVLKRLTEGSTSPGQLYRRFREGGFTHILYHAGGMMGAAVRADELGADRYPWAREELRNYEQFFLRFTRKLPLPVGDGYSLYEVLPREGFSPLPEYLPGTESYYLRSIGQALGFKKLSEIYGRSLPPSVYLQAYGEVQKQHPELGYPCFQTAFAGLAGEPDSPRRALDAGLEGFRRNGDKASWLILRGNAALVRKKNSEALPLLEEAQKLSPEREDVARNLAAAYYNDHRPKKALEQAERAAALAPFSAEYQNLARQLRAVIAR